MHDFFEQIWGGAWPEAQETHYYPPGFRWVGPMSERYTAWEKENIEVWTYRGSVGCACALTLLLIVFA